MKFAKYFAAAIVGLAGSASNAGVYVDKAHLGDLVVSDSYFVKFKDVSDAKGRILPLAKSLNSERRLVEGGFSKAMAYSNASNQSIQSVAQKLGVPGKVANVYESLNLVHVRLSEAEARKLATDERVEWVEQEGRATKFGTQSPVGWALDRLDATTPALDSSYSYTYNGAGQNIVVVDTGFPFNLPSFQAAEFGSRLSFLGDVNAGGVGNDCDPSGHGTRVASIAASNTYGVAKGASVWVIKNTVGCGSFSNESNDINIYNYLATTAPVGTIVNLSSGYANLSGCASITHQPTEVAIRAMFNAGLIVVVAAGNDSCNTADFTPTRMPEVFVVGGTTNQGIGGGQDWITGSTRTGSNIGAFAPGVNIDSFRSDGTYALSNATSFAAPIASGVFASACHSIAGQAVNCNNTANTAAIYNAVKSLQPMGTVVGVGGGALPNGSPSRFIGQRW